MKTDITEKLLAARNYLDTSWQDEGIYFKEFRIEIHASFYIEIGLSPDFYVNLVMADEWEQLNITTLSDLDDLIRLLSRLEHDSKKTL